jgi:hypothetical protein
MLLATSGIVYVREPERSRDRPGAEDVLVVGLLEEEQRRLALIARLEARAQATSRRLMSANPTATRPAIQATITRPPTPGASR